MKQHPTATSLPKNHWLWILMIAAVVWLVFGQTLGFDFLSWDDDQNVVNNRWLHQGLWPQFWFKPYLCMYLPPVYSAWYALSLVKKPLDPAVFHAFNVTVHMINSILVYIVTALSISMAKSRNRADQEKIVTNDHLAALFAAMAFALHPLQVESVAWITGLRDAMSATGSLTATWLFLRARDRLKVHLLAWVAFGFALLCKPSAVALPAAVLGLSWIGSLIKTRSYLWRIAPWFLTCIPIIYITKAAQTEIADKELLQLSIWQNFAVTFDSYGFYLKKWLFPFVLTNDYGRKPSVALTDPWLPLIILAVFALAAAICLSRQRIGALIQGWVLFAVIAVAPVSGIVNFPFQHTSTVTDHYLYLSLASLSAALSLIIWKLKPTIAAALSLALLMMWATIDLKQLANWRSDKTMFPSMVAANPQSYAGLTGMAALAMRDKKREEALSYIIAAQKIDPNKVDLLANKGLVLNELGRYDEVLKELGAILPSRQIVIDSPVSAPSVATYYMMMAYANIKLLRIAESLPYLCIAQWADATNKDVIGFMPLVLQHLGHSPNDNSVCAQYLK